MATMSGMRHDDMVGVSARAIRIGVLDNDPFALDAMCAMISAVSKDFRVMWSTGSPAVAIEHCHNPHTRPEVLVLDMALGGINGRGRVPAHPAQDRWDRHRVRHLVFRGRLPAGGDQRPALRDCSRRND